jgi:hypothetical protein
MGNDLRSLTKSFTSAVWWLSVASIASVVKMFDSSPADVDATAVAMFQAGDTIQRGVIELAYAATAGLLDPRNWARLPDERLQ